MFGARKNLARLNLLRTKRFSSNGNKPTNTKSDKIQSGVSNYDEAYKQLDKLDFMTASKILFTELPKKKTFGLDFHLVQLFFACLPSLAVYLVAQYARREMKKMDAELERKKKEEEEKAKEIEEKAIEEKEAGSTDLLEVKARLNKLEETVKEIVVESKKQPGDDVTKKQEKNERESAHQHDSTIIRSESGKLKLKEPAPGLDEHKVTKSAPLGASLLDQKDKIQNGGNSHDRKQ